MTLPPRKGRESPHDPRINGLFERHHQFGCLFQPFPAPGDEFRLMRAAARRVGPAHTEDTQYLRVYVGHLRQKIEEQPDDPKIIVTEPGIGYRIAERV